MLNNTIEQIEKLDEVIDAIDNKDIDTAIDKLRVMKSTLQEELDKAALLLNFQPL
jgi:hypothetical protein